MIDNPNSDIYNIQQRLKLDNRLFKMIISKLNYEEYINISNDFKKFEVEMKGYEFKVNYWNKLIHDIFKDFIFQIILNILIFALGLKLG